MSPGGLEHSEITARAVFTLETHNRAHRLGRVLTGEAGVIVARRPDTVRGADVAFVSNARLPKGERHRGFLRVAPELVIEVLSLDVSWEEMEAKVSDYHGFGVDLVWVLDPQTLTLRTYERGKSPQILRDTETASADPYVPGFTSHVCAFFGD
jgi:Uma2 family endonuclease